MKRRFRLVLASAVTALAACSVITGPDGYDPPPEDRSLDPAALRAPQLLYLCGVWVDGAPPTEENILIDVSLSRPSLELPEDRPTSAHLAVIREHGGQVVYQFHFPAARVWIPVRKIPALALSRSVIGIFKVADPRRYDWNAGVGYRLPYSYTEGEVRYAQLGGRVTHRFNVINAISGLIPDRSAAVLRRDGNVRSVESRVPFPFCSA